MTEDNYTIEQVIEALKAFSKRNEHSDTNYEPHRILAWYIEKLSDQKTIAVNGGATGASSFEGDIKPVMKIYGIMPDDYDACYYGTFYTKKEDAEAAVQNWVDEKNAEYKKRNKASVAKISDYCVDELELVL